MTERHFEANQTVRTATAFVALFNGLAMLVSVTMFAVLGRPVGIVLSPLWLWGSIEAGRAAWSNVISVTLTPEVLRIERSGSTDIVDLDDVSWFGLTRRGAVVEATTGRFSLFDQDWKTSAALVRELDAVVRSRQRADSAAPTPLTVSHDQLRQITNIGLLALVAIGAALVTIAAVVGDVSTIERVVSLGTAGPICVLVSLAAIRLLRRPVSATFCDGGNELDVDLKRLYGSSTRTTSPSVLTAPSVTLSQRLTGAAPGETVVVSTSGLTWTGPIAAPGTFDHVAELHGSQ